MIDKKCCVVASCTNSFNIECDSTQNSNNILFHKFPTDTLLCNKWLEFCNLPKDYLLRCPNSYVCSEHFDKNVYKQNVNSEVKYSLNIIINHTPFLSKINYYFVFYSQCI